MNTVGIDVGAYEHCVVIRKNGKPGKARSFTNDASGYHDIIRVLKKAKVKRICIEATGVYHLDLAVALSQIKQFELMVVNPKAAKHYMQAVMTRSKTDSIDAEKLAEYAEHMPFQVWQCPQRFYLDIRAFSRRLAALSKQGTQAKNQLHALQATDTTPAYIIEDVKLSIAQTAAQIDALRQHALDFINEQPLLKETFDLLISVKGIAQASAIQLMGELLVLPEDMTAKQWVAMAGLNPRHHQSGKSINKKARISKEGNRFLRMALYMPSLSASRHDVHVRGYYMHLIENRGLKKIQAVCAVMRKLLHAIHGMLKSRKAFDNTRFFDLSKSAT